MSLIKSILILTLSGLIAGFCILNNQVLTITWSPFHETTDMPLYAIVVTCFFTGFLIGAVMVWINSGHLRKARRDQKKQIKTLEKELQEHENAVQAVNPVVLQ